MSDPLNDSRRMHNTARDVLWGVFDIYLGVGRLTLLEKGCCMTVKLTDNKDAILKKVHDKLNQIVPLNVLFSDDFMSRHTQFKSWREMLDAGHIETVEDISTELLSELVAANSSFAGFTEMKGLAF